MLVNSNIIEDRCCNCRVNSLFYFKVNIVTYKLEYVREATKYKYNSET